MSVRKDEVQVSVIVDGKQGISELGKLEMEANDLRHTMQGLKKDSKEYAEAAEQYKQVKARMAEVREQIGLAGMTMKQMQAYARELQTELNTTATRGTQRYEELKDKLQEVNAAIAQQRSEVAGTSSFWSKISTEVKQFGMLAVGALGFQFVTQQISNLIEKGKKLADELSDIQKTTGMTAGEVRQLNSDLSKVDTRTSTSELRKMAAAAGQLGIAKDDIQSFTVATDKLTVALGDEFQGGAEEVTKVMGSLRNIFSDIKSDKVDVDMLHIGNAINELGASGAATGPVVADFANRIGGVGITMGLTSGQVLGLSATLQELNVSTERGGTAVVKILQKMASEPEKFAKVAGMSVKDFTNLVNNDLYAAFTKVTEGAGKTGSQATALAKTLDELGVDGAGASEVMAKLGTNTSLLNDKVKLASTSLGQTNSIMNEFETKNNNLAGKIEKLTKAFSGMFTNSGFNAGLELAVDGLSRLFGLTNEADELTQAMREQRQVVESLERDAVPLIDRYEELKNKAALNKDEQKELDTVIAQLAKTIPTAVTEFDEYGKALGINVKVAREFIEQQKAMLSIKNAETIEANTKELAKLEYQIKETQKALQADEYGHRWKEVQVMVKRAGGEFDFVTNRVKLTNAEVAALAAGLAKLQQEASGRRGIIAEAKGEKTAEQQAAEAAARIKQTGLAEEVARLGLLQEIDAKIKALTEQQAASRSKREILQLQHDITEQQELRQRLLGEYKDKESAKDQKQRDKEHAEALKAFRTLQQAALDNQAKLRAVDQDADQQAQNQVAAHYDELLKKALEFSQNSKLTATERREAMQTIDLLADSKEEALANLKAEQAKRRAEEELKFLNEHEMAKINLRIMLAKRNEKRDPQELEAALIAKVEKERDIELQNTKLTEDQRQLIIQDAEDKIAAIRASSADKQMQQAEKALQQLAQYTDRVLSAMFNFMNQQDNAQLKSVEKNKNERLKKLEQEHKAGRLSNEKYEEQKARIQQEADDKTAAIKRKQFEREKVASVAKVLMETSIAVMQAYSQGGPYAGPFLAALVGAVGAVQLATIYAQQPPEFREGGFTANGMSNLPYTNLSRHPGGLLPEGPYLATVNEEGAEYFVPHHLLQQPVVARSVEVIEAVRTGQAVPAGAYAQGGYSAPAATAAPAFSSPSSTGGPAMTEATGQAIVQRLDVLTQHLLDGNIPTQLVPEALARYTTQLAAARNGASF